MPVSQPKRVAVIGGGCSGVASFWALQDSIHDVHLFEASTRLGGRIKARSVEYGDSLLVIDPEPSSFNAETSPNIVSLLRYLGISTSADPLEFCTSVGEDYFQWGCSTWKTVLRHFYSLETYRMLFEIVQFKYSAIDVLTDKSRTGKQYRARRLSTHEYLKREGFSDDFRDKYLIPLISILWGMNAARILPQFPIENLCRVLYHHRLLCLPQSGPKWQRIKAGTSMLVQRMASNFPAAKVHLEMRVSGIRHLGKDQFKLTTSDGRKWHFDHVIFTVDAQECMKILDSTILREEWEILKQMRVSEHIAVLHSDPTFTPRKLISPCNYIISANNHSQIPKSCLTYTQSTPYDRISITLNPFTPPDIQSVHALWQYSDYEVSPDTLSALRLLPSIQNKRGLSFCASWSGLGFLEDAVTAGMTLAVDHLGAELPFELDYHRELHDDILLDELRLNIRHRMIRVLVELVRAYVLVFEILFVVLVILFVPIARLGGWRKSLG